MIEWLKYKYEKAKFAIFAYRHYSEVKFFAEIGVEVVDNARAEYQQREGADKLKPIKSKMYFEWREIAARCEND